MYYNCVDIEASIMCQDASKSSRELTSTIIFSLVWSNEFTG